jgi:hypothetical protein
LSVRNWAAAVAVLAATAGPCGAADARFGSFTDFIDRYNCATTARLQALYAAKSKPGQSDRYLIASLVFAPDQFVQCLLEDDNSEILCEAASGFYTSNDGRPRTYQPSEATRTAIKRLGFSDDDSGGNFSLTRKLGSIADLPAISTLMLATLYDAYGANLLSDIELIAPRAPLSREAQVKCTPLS